MKYRLFASDIDDTLLAHNGSLPEASRDALRVLHEAGVTVVLSSGRATSSMMPIVHSIIEPADDEYIISFNGGRVVTAKSGTIIFEQAIPQTVLFPLMEYIRKAELHAHGYAVGEFLVEEQPGMVPERAQTYAEKAAMKFRVVEDIAASLPDGSVKVLIIGEHETLEKHRRILSAEFEGVLECMFSKPHYLEVVSSGVSKGHALQMLAKRLEISLEECVSLGDSTNDISMIQTAGVGLAVANARDELKAVASEVLTRTNDESAVVEMIEKYFPEIYSNKLAR